MLLFIKLENHNMTFYSVFQYISCYSLSGVEKIVVLKSISFNTSHVTLYRRNRRLICLSIVCFNTSHVTLYHHPFDKKHSIKQFQYISCYSLSYFAGGISERSYTFQYISCYSLSFQDILNEGTLELFQYISCYSLSLVL